MLPARSDFRLPLRTRLPLFFSDCLLRSVPPRDIPALSTLVEAEEAVRRIVVPISVVPTSLPSIVDIVLENPSESARMEAKEGRTGD